MKTCTRCKEDKPFEAFPKDSWQKDNLGIYCKPCRNTHYQTGKNAPPEKRREYNYKANYGITIADYDRMFEEQGGCCAICGTTDTGKHGRLYVDHCHDTSEVRGLLCQNCNVGLGHFKDNTLFLARAIEYLQEC